MYSRRQQKLIARVRELGGLPRRRLLQGAATVGLATILRPTALYAESDDDDERVSGDDREKAHNICPPHRFGEFSDWSAPIWLGPIVNSSEDDLHPAISHNGLSLYITSRRSGGFGNLDIWVSQRDTRDDPWGPPQNLGQTSTLPPTSTRQTSRPMGTGCSSAAVDPPGRMTSPGSGFRIAGMWMTTSAGSRR